MTSRLYPSGLQGKYGLQPDLTTLGKYIGGGLTIGAFGGRKDLLEVYDPRLSSAMPHSGTFNNNTLAMAAGYAALSEVYTMEANYHLNKLGDVMRDRLQDLAKGTKMSATGIGGVLTIHFTSTGVAPSCVRDIETTSLPNLKRLFWFWCTHHGFWVAERGMIALSLGITMSEIEAFVDSVRTFLQTHRDLLCVSLSGEDGGR
jgi:glutamate-1-semialdehyde 2,1-aminomutase